MINKRLIALMGKSKKYIAGHVISQWISLVSNIAFLLSVGWLFQSLSEGRFEAAQLLVCASAFFLAMLLRHACTILASRMSQRICGTVKKTLRHRMYEKLLALGPSYNQRISTAEIIQLSVEGVEQLEVYFGLFLPQFFYAMLAPLTLFSAIAFISLPTAVVLLLCVPLIPISIVFVQRLAKKLFSRYWTRYTSLGNSFLENLQGLTTLKIYQADEMKHKEMNAEAEHFRKITMRVLTAQLNSITVMDLVSFGGAALGMYLAIGQFAGGMVGVAGCISIILLSADFFIPMRQLGSFFHVAMNGMAASETIFDFLNSDTAPQKPGQMNPADHSIACRAMRFAYDAGRDILCDIDLEIPQGSVVSIVGESGSGKSTVAGILCGRNKGYTGEITIGGVPLCDISEDSLAKNITYISHNSYFFKGTVRDNLLLAVPAATDEAMWQMLRRVNLAAFLETERGLQTHLTENASNLSGGQRQRLALCRALLHDSAIYIVDEATSNIDADSERDIITRLYALAGTKTIVLISHRLMNVVKSDRIYVMKNGRVAEHGSHLRLVSKGGAYYALWSKQQVMEGYVGGAQ